MVALLRGEGVEAVKGKHRAAIEYFARCSVGA